MNTTPLVIEFIGLPGAGKTTTAQIAIESLTSVGYHCFAQNTLENPESIEKKRGGILSKLRMLYHFLLSCVLYRNFAWNAFKFALTIKPFSFVNLRRFIVLVVRLKFLRSKINGNYDLFILDQGLIQYVWSIAITGKQSGNSNYLEGVLKSIINELSLYVIMVDVEAELAIKRIIARPTMRSRFDRMSPSSAEIMLSEHKKMFSQIVNLSASFRNTGYLSVNGRQSIQENVGIIVPFINQAWQSRNA